MGKRIIGTNIVPAFIRNYIEKKIKPNVYYDKYKMTAEQPRTLNKTYNIQNIESFYFKKIRAENINKALYEVKSDPDGAKLFHYNGKDYYHPVIMAQWGLKLASAFKNTENEEYVHLARIQADKLVQQAVFFKGLPYFPYSFDFKAGEYAGEYDDGMMKAPWYSGMAQGQALSLFILLYELTGIKNYLEYAESAFKTLTILREEKEIAPWLSYIDDRGYFWIEEYPMDNHPSNVLNGFIFAVFGLHDYYRLTGKGRAFLNKALQTVEHYLPKYRNPGNISFYDLKYKKKYARYHKLHIKQLSMLYRITEDPYFQAMGDLFYKDH